MAKTLLFILLFPAYAFGQWNESGDNATSGRILLSGPVSSIDYDDISIIRNKPAAGIKVFNENLGGRAILFLGQAYGGKYGYLAHHGQSHDPGPLYSQTFLPSSTILVGSDVNGLGLISSSDIRFHAGGLDDSKQKMVIQSNGNVGIGTKVADEKLTVNGTVHAEEIRIDVDVADVPDYVFKADYALMSLSELEEYILRNGHLPEVHAAADLATEGMKVMEMNLLLLKKVEELTLHLIEQNRVNARQAEEIKELRERIKALMSNKME